MQKILFYIRVLLESMLLWGGGIVLFFIITFYLYDPVVHSFGRSGSTVFYVILTALLAAALLWVIIARRKDLGERISTGVYVLLNLLPPVLYTFLILGWIAGIR